MRIQHKYIRNHHFQKKHWKRVRAKEHPFQTSFPWVSNYCDPVEDQIRRAFERIDKTARHIENGYHNPQFYVGCPSAYRRGMNKIRKARERTVMAKIRNGEYELEMPHFKRDAAWDYW